MKLLLTLFLTSCLFVSCEKKSTDSQILENEKIVNQYFDYFNKHEWIKLSEMYSDTAEFKDPSFGQGIVKKTRKEFVEKYSEMSSVFTDIKDSIVQIYPSGENQIIVEFVSTGSHPDYSKFELPICTIFTIENGIITKDFTYYDSFE